MGEHSDEQPVAVEKGDEHLGARVDAETYKRVRVAAAENDEPMTDFVRKAVAAALSELDEGNQKKRAATASS